MLISYEVDDKERVQKYDVLFVSGVQVKVDLKSAKEMKRMGYCHGSPIDDMESKKQLLKQQLLFDRQKNDIQVLVQENIPWITNCNIYSG